MQFPVTIELGSLALSIHAPLEAAAYVVGFLLLRRERRRYVDPFDAQTRWTLVVVAIFGAVIGSKLVHWVNEWPTLIEHLDSLETWLGGKSIVGGLLGGTLAVELLKRRRGITRATGDVYVFPLLASIAIGRVGCFLAGLDDHTFGSATSLPWGVDFGDGVTRHPTQIYEIVFLGALALVLARRRAQMIEGELFDTFLFSYLGARVMLDVLKPYPHWLGLSGTQFFALAGIVARLWFVRARERTLAERAT